VSLHHPALSDRHPELSDPGPEPTPAFRRRRPGAASELSRRRPRRHGRTGATRTRGP